LSLLLREKRKEGVYESQTDCNCGFCAWLSLAREAKLGFLGRTGFEYLNKTPSKYLPK